jgi:nitroreductase
MMGAMAGDLRVFTIDEVQSALEVAVRAPSIHNTQPWRWRLDEDGLALLADRSRQLAVADPDGHSLVLSCGAALCLAEVGLRAQGRQIETDVFPKPDDPDLLARITSVGVGEPADDDVARADAALRRRCDRRPFSDHRLAESEVESLQAAASDTRARVDVPTLEDQRIDLAVAVSWADRIERDDAAYIAEMSHWLHDPEVHALSDGIPVDVVPHVPAEHPRHVDVPLRDFELGMSGRQLVERDVDEHPVIAVVMTDFDNPTDHLWAGHSMMRLMLQAELTGLATCPLSQAVDFAAFRTRVQRVMGWVGYPQIMLRVGYPRAPTTEIVRTPRREPSAVLEIARPQ